MKDWNVIPLWPPANALGTDDPDSSFPLLRSSDRVTHQIQSTGANAFTYDGRQLIEALEGNPPLHCLAPHVVDCERSDMAEPERRAPARVPLRPPIDHDEVMVAVIPRLLPLLQARPLSRCDRCDRSNLLYELATVPSRTNSKAITNRSQ